jgi:vitamin-K-epoxide reductase (warfarin-sensitive)
MKYTLLILAILGIIVSSLALREHYREAGDAPCDINAHWDCGTVNHSPYAMFYGVPVAAIGIGGYLLLGLLAFRRAYSWMLPLVTIALLFAVHLADIENYVLGVWCIYCVISLGIISVMTLLNLGTVIAQSIRKPRSA